MGVAGAIASALRLVMLTRRGQSPPGQVPGGGWRELSGPEFT